MKRRTHSIWLCYTFTSNCSTHSQIKTLKKKKLDKLGMKRARNWQLQSSLRHLQLMQMQSNSYYFILRAALLCELHNRQRRRTKLSRSAIQSPKLAGWEHLLNFGNDDSFLNVTGMSRHAFMEMEKILFSTPEEQRPNHLNISKASCSPKALASVWTKVSSGPKKCATY